MTSGDQDRLIQTARLDLHAVQPNEYELLAVDRDHPDLWLDRGFCNPHGHLVAEPGPLPYRIPRIREQPELAKYLLRIIVLRSAGEAIGSAGFHSGPDADGMIEIGLGIEPPFRGYGYAQEALRGMWDWVVGDPGVKTLRYTVTKKQHRSVPVTVVGSISNSLAISGNRVFAFREFLGSPNIKNREEQGLRGLVFDTALPR